MKLNMRLLKPALIVAAVIVIIFLTVPKFIDTVERSKAGEAFNYLTTIRSAYEKYHSRSGTYMQNLRDLEIDSPNPQYFNVKDSDASKNNWSVTLQRKSGYGKYTVTFNKYGFDSQNSTIAKKINPIVRVN